MVRLSRWAVSFLACGVVLACGRPALAGSSGEPELRQRCEALSQAFTRQDLPDIRSALASQVTMGKGKQVTQDEYMRGIGRMFQAFRGAPHAALTRQIDSVVVRGNLGSVAAAQTMSLQDKAGNVHQLHDRLLQTWRKVGSTWLLVRELEGREPLNWNPVVSQEGGFSVSMPDTPRELVQPLKTVDGPKESHLLAAETQDGRQGWVVSYRDLPSSLQGMPADHLLECLRDFEARVMRLRLASSRKTSIQGCPGLDYTLKAASGLTMRHRLLLANGRIYQVVASSRNGQLSAADVQKFMGSFKLLASR